MFVHAGFNFEMGEPLEDTQSHLWLMDWYKNKPANCFDSKIIIHGHKCLDSYNIRQMCLDAKTFGVINIDNGITIHEPHYGAMCVLNLDTLTPMFIESEEN